MLFSKPGAGSDEWAETWRGAAGARHGAKTCGCHIAFARTVADCLYGRTGRAIGHGRCTTHQCLFLSAFDQALPIDKTRDVCPSRIELSQERICKTVAEPGGP